MTRTSRLGGTLAAAILCGFSIAPAAVATSRPGLAQSPDQQHAFDFHFGAWRTQILRRASTASGATRWIRMTGTVIDRPLWHGRANLEKIEASGSGGHFQGLTLFLYDPKAGEWSQQYADSSDGIMNEPVYGQFRNGRGVLFGWSGSGGKRTLERDTWSDIMPNSYHFEIASSADGGKSWVKEFIAQLTRVEKQPDYGTSSSAGSGPEHGFDFNIGRWSTRIRAVLNPLSAPGVWSSLQGTHVVYRIWSDWANM